MRPNLKDFPYSKTFEADPNREFAAENMARKWLANYGFGIGSMSVNEPRGIKRGSEFIGKWRNLSPEDILSLDGIVMSDNYRNSNVTVYLKESPEGLVTNG